MLVLALQRTVGNRAVARLVTASGHRSRGRMLQRAILQMSSWSDGDAEREELELSVKLMLRRGDRGSVQRVYGREHFPRQLDIRPTETVYVLSHSGGATVGDLFPVELAGLLFKALPDGYRGKIVLVACHSADEKPHPSRGPLSKLGEMSYARHLAYHLNDHQQRSQHRTAVSEVRGRRGISTLDPVTGARRSLPEEASGEPGRRLAAWSMPREDGVRAAHRRLSEVKADAERKGDFALGSIIFEARQAIADEWTRACEHKLSLLQLDVGARTGSASSVGYSVAPQAPRIPPMPHAPAPHRAQAHARIDQRLTEHLAELRTLVADIVLRYNAGQNQDVRTAADNLVARGQSWAATWAEPGADTGAAASASTQAAAGGSAATQAAAPAGPPRTIAVESETVTVEPGLASATTDPSAGKPPTNG
jgi:hypothetical protein